MPGSSPITRRRLLQTSAFASLAALAPRLWPDPLGIAPGVQLYTVGADLLRNPRETLQQLAAIGYKNVEGFPKETNLSAIELRRLLNDFNLRMVSIHLPFDSKDMAPHFEDAHTLGASSVVSSTLAPDDFAERKREPGKNILETMTAEDYRRLADKANRVAQLSKAAGFAYAYHNHYFEFRDLGNGRIGYDILLEHTDPELVKFEIDCGWMILAGHDPIHYMRSYPGRFRMLHIKDFVKGPVYTGGPNRPVGTELGRGRIDYDPIFREAARAGIVYYFVEQEPPFIEGLTPLEAASVDYKYLHAM
jgi:sugar phosphate isomerase/epimerase